MSRSRFLFVAPPFVAHVNPLASISAELLAGGHEVGWVTYESIRHLLPAGVNFYAVEEDETYRRVQEHITSHETRFLAEGFVFFYRDIVIPLLHSMHGRVQQAAGKFRPHAMVVDHHALAGAFAARSLGIPWATSAPSAQLLAESVGAVKAAQEWLETLLCQAQAEFALEPAASSDVSPDLVLLYTTRALVGESPALAERFKLVGPAIDHRFDDTPFPWEALSDSPRILVSLGSILGNRIERFLNVVAGALADLPVQVIVSASANVLSEPPPNFLVRPWLPQIKLLPHVNAVITHGGSTVNEALAFGLPLIVAPVVNDNFVYADQVARAGAGLRVRFGRIGPAEMREAVLSILKDPGYKDAAIRVRDSYREAGGSAAAACYIEGLASKTSA